MVTVAIVPGVMLMLMLGDPDSLDRVMNIELAAGRQSH